MNFESLSDVLKHPVRRKIILTLSERGNLSYVDLMNFVGVNNTGRLNYHLKILGDLIEKDQNGRYVLTEKGQMAAQLLQKFPEKKPPPTPLSMADAAVIGFAGVVLTVVNPVFWISAIIALLKLELDVPFFLIIEFSTLAYALIIPGTVMRLLTVRRTNSHDMYDLMKPPLITFIMLLALLTIMLFLKANLVITIKSPTIQGPQVQTDGGQWSTAQYSFMQTSLQTLLFWGLILSFLGVLIAELASKLRKRMTL